MPKPVISVEHLTKKYDLGVIGTGTLTRDLERWWARVRKQPDPYTRIGQEDRFKRFGESILALDDVSFKVEQGEALGIIGRNGAGKSTLLKILSRVTAPTSGVVKVKGRIGSLLEVGTGFHPELTGRENIYLNGAILGMKKTEVTRKFDQIVDFSGVEKFIDTPVKRYSSGMYVRLAFAVAAHLDPEILIVDEVLAVGDAEFQKKCLGKMGDVTGEGRTVLFVSHNLEAVKALCQRSLVLNGGQIQIDSDTEQAVSSYIERNTGSTYLANFENDERTKITQIWLSDDQNNKKDNFSIGELITVNIELSNPNKESVNIDLSFLNRGNIKLWNFSHEKLNLMPINQHTKSMIRYIFRVPKVNHAEIFIHVGLHKRGVTSPYYIDHIREGLRFSINENQKNENDNSTSIFNCPVEYEELKIE